MTNADPNFDRADLTWFDSPTVYSAAFDDKKGLGYGLEWTVFDNGILTCMYNDWKKSATRRRKRTSLSTWFINSNRVAAPQGQL
ncbi:hypothetical protein [Sporomusa sp. KB1]|jgi:hypothetical protein|uniref:hypothetical protein n=1 Tax=Sporomusa sp. KB1 TaxID=943346 RepID=UPI00119F685A|nr:hypothetical protein [Sporomusa sp. KB1]